MSKIKKKEKKLKTERKCEGKYGLFRQICI